MFERYFDYSNPSYIYKALNKTRKQENKAQVNIIENRLANSIEVLKGSPTSDVKKNQKQKQHCGNCWTCSLL